MGIQNPGTPNILWHLSVSGNTMCTGTSLKDVMECHECWNAAVSVDEGKNAT